MKPITYLKINISVISLLLSGILLFNISCNKDEIEEKGYKKEAPVITGVRFVDPDKGTDTISSAGLGEYVAILGKNLYTTQEIYFNDEKSEINVSFNNDNSIVVQISDSTPTLATHNESEVPNQIKIVTLYGEATFSFITLPPPPKINYISNSFANEGDVITIEGKYFYFIDSVIFPGGIPGTNISSAANGLSCTVTVPNGITEGGLLRVVSQSGVATNEANNRFNDTSGVFLNFEDTSMQVQKLGVKFYDENDNPEIPNCRGKYAHAFKMDVATASYWIIETALETSDSIAAAKLTYPDIPLKTKASELALEFEMYVADTWNSGYYEIAFLPKNDWAIAYRILWEPYSDLPEKSFKLRDWKTFRIPLTEFSVDAILSSSTDPEELKKAVIPNYYEDIKGTAFNFNFKNNAEEAGGLKLPIINIAWDNCRIVKMK